ncbi:MAG: ElyC/SanA/YdcF family protein [bacterium]|nr:ElyC/SanA/YdcF family protein [bacterium]MDZ4284658.1 ElyC/SanA/YdcF family protein [Patescibacteria group bacterium]
MQTVKEVRVAQKRWFIVPMAFGRDREIPVPDPEGGSRCEKAFRLAKKIGDRRDSVWILLGAAIPHRYGEPFGEQTLADLAERWLINRAWEPLQIIKNPKGNNTRTELLAIRQVERWDRRLRWGGEKSIRVRIVTSWWHAPRVWLAAFIIFHRPIRVSMARTKLSWRSLAKELPKELAKLLCEGLCTIASIRRARSK